MELWSGMTQVGSLTAELVIQLVAHHYATVRMQEQMRAELDGGARRAMPYETTSRPPAKAVPISRERMESRRAGRRARKRG
ncbi:MAG TPA: hypothetical protein VMR23_01910 [Candidatus Limnocylindria bacterium]|nr:hypothetical protein [Candidatus Limnocylindria bacterium]